MPDRYRVGTDNSWGVTAGWSTTSGGPGGASVPTNADNVFLDANSLADLTLSGVTFRSLNTTGFTKALTITGSISYLGDLIITVPVTGTGTLSADATTGSFIINTNGNTPTLAFNISNSVVNTAIYSLSSPLRTAACLVRGVFRTNGHNINSTTFQILNTGKFEPSTSTMTVTGSVNIPTNAGAITNGASCRFVCNGNTAFNGGNQTFGHITINPAVAGDLFTLGGANTFAIGLTYNTLPYSKLTFTGASQTIGAFIVNGNRDYPQVYGDSICNISASSTDLNLCLFKNINASGAASWGDGTTGGIGGIGGTSGFNFTPPSVVTATSSGNWTTTVAWSAGRPPLPQDEARIHGTGTTITLTNTSFRSLFIGSLSCTATTPTVINFSVGNNALYVSRGGYSVGTNVTTSSLIIILQAVENGTYHLSSLVSSSVANRLITRPLVGVNATYVVDTNFYTTETHIDSGNFVLGPGCDIFTTDVFTTNDTTDVKSVDLGTSTLALTLTGTLTMNSTGLSLSALDSTITMNQGGTGTMNLGPFEYGTIKFTGAGTGNADFAGTGPTTIKTLASERNVSFGIRIASGKTLNVENFLISGKQGFPVNLSASSGVANLNKTGSGIVSSNYLNITNITASPADTWFAGRNSVPTGTTTGWIFEYAPGTGPTINLFFISGF